jgi:hypothetical protein
VGDDVDFPFTFMRGSFETSSEISSVEAEKARPKSEGFPVGLDDLYDGEIIPVATPASAKSPKKTQASSAPQTRRQRSTRHREPADVDKKRSLSLNSLDDLKPPKTSPEKFPFFTRLGRSWSRRLSAAL